MTSYQRTTSRINRGRPMRAEAKREELENVVVPADEILRFARLWYRFGGGDAIDIMTTFGWSSERYFSDLQTIVRAPGSSHLTDQMRTAILDVCFRRLSEATG